jgi:hypothetical protein
MVMPRTLRDDQSVGQLAGVAHFPGSASIRGTDRFAGILDADPDVVVVERVNGCRKHPPDGQGDGFDAGVGRNPCFPPSVLLMMHAKEIGDVHDIRILVGSMRIS